MSTMPPFSHRQPALAARKASLWAGPWARPSHKCQALPTCSASTDAPPLAYIARMSSLGGPELVLPFWLNCEVVVPVTASASPDPNEDLSATLRHIAPTKLAKTRASLANSPETREFLELGLTLLRIDLLEHTGPDLEQGIHSRLFESLSRERIMALAKDQDTEGTHRLGVGMFRNRWERKGQYTEDLIAYLFRLEPQKRHFEEMAEAGRALTKEVSFGELIRLLAAAETEAVMSDQRVSLQSM